MLHERKVTRAVKGIDCCSSYRNTRPVQQRSASRTWISDGHGGREYRICKMSRNRDPQDAVHRREGINARKKDGGKGGRVFLPMC